MKVRVRRSKVRFPLVKKKDEEQKLFFIAERYEGKKLAAYSMMTHPKGL